MPHAADRTRPAWVARVSGTAAWIGPWVVLAIWVMFFAPRSSSGDPGVKLAQATALWESGFTSRALDVDDETDPQGSYAPYGVPFVRIIDGERQGIYSILFTGINAPVIGLLGRRGVPVVPLLGSLLVALGIALVLRRTGAHWGWIAATSAIALLATPILIYSAELFEHTLAAGLVTLGLAMLVGREGQPRRWGLAAGILVALAAAVRPEAYCAVAAAGVAVAVAPAPSHRDRLQSCAWFLAGSLLILAVYWTVNLATANAWDPAVATNEGRSTTIDGARTMLITQIKGGSWLWFLALPAIVLGALVPPRLGRGLAAFIVCVSAGVLLVVIGYLAQEHSTDRTLSGVLAVTPLACWGLAAGPFDRRTRPLWVFPVLYIPLVLVFERSGVAGGLQIGSRYLIPAIPPLLLLVAELIRREAAERRWWARALIALPALLLVALSLRGMYGDSQSLPKYVEILDNATEAEDLVRTLDSDVVVTRRLWESRVLAPLVLEGRRIYTCQGELGPVLVDRLARSGVTRFVYVSNRPVDIPLQDGRRARTVNLQPGWMYVQEVEIQ